MLRGVCLAVLLTLLTGCTITGDSFTCANPGDGPDPCPARCPGDCVPKPPIEDDFKEPALVWIGESHETPPPCPNKDSTSEAFAGLVGLPFCPACRCDAPSGSCELTTELRAHAAPCWSGGAETSFDAPANWNGDCTPLNGIDAMKDCMGELCVQSLTVAELELLAETPCSPVAGIPGARSHRWAKRARFCPGEEHPACLNTAHFCAPKPPKGFMHCIVTNKVAPCPKEYPISFEQFYYDNKPDHVTDERSCTPCTCADPVGGTCVSEFHFYSDSLCAVELYTQTASSDKPVCHDIVPDGTALLSKQAEPPTYIPGECAPLGGEEIGTLVPQNPVTICCL